MRVAIVGAGWYGCHIANYLKSLGVDVQVFDRNTAILQEASGKNQNRLHLGFHYARDYDTRMQSRDGYNRFLERYGMLTHEVERNYYAVASRDSLMDFRTYKTIMASSGLEFSELDRSQIPVNLTNVAGVLSTDERVIDERLARSFFEFELNAHLCLGQRVDRTEIEEFSDHIMVQGEQFDYLVDATWSKLYKPDMPILYEPTLLLYYRNLGPQFALTLVDGPLASIYPTSDEGVVTLSSVSHTPLGQYATYAEAEDRLSNLSKEEINDCRFKMEEEILRYYPEFCSQFEYLGPQLSMKTKPVGKQDNRACYVSTRGRIFQVMSGKIDTIFFASERILSAISIKENQAWTYSSATRGLSEQPWQTHERSTNTSTAQQLRA